MSVVIGRVSVVIGACPLLSVSVVIGVPKIDISHSRPRVSNDNPFSEAHFKTLKTQPCYPKYFNDLNHARQWCGEFFDWYNDEHHHSGLNGHIPADVFHGRANAVNAVKQRALDAAYSAHPERFVNGPPTAKAPPTKVSINPLPISVVTVPTPTHNNEIKSKPSNPLQINSAGKTTIN